MNTSQEYGEAVAKVALDINAIKLKPDDPFTWASGYRMPIYNDNRMMLLDPEDRGVVVCGLFELLEEEGIRTDALVIAGTATSGIPWATSLADYIGNPLIYVRDKPKGHGMQNRIEGVDADKDLEGRTVVVVEDLISTGGSSASAVQGVRDGNGVVTHLFSIFNYGLPMAEAMFRGEEAFNKEGDKLSEPVIVSSVLTYDTLLKVARDTGYINAEQTKMLEDWRADPFGWGIARGFPKVEK